MQQWMSHCHPTLFRSNFDPLWRSSAYAAAHHSFAAMWGFEMLYANIQDGFMESIVRGHRSGLLTVPDYNNLCQCENLEDIKLNLVRERGNRDEIAPRVSPSSPTVAEHLADAFAADGHRLWPLPSERGITPVHYDHRGAVHAEAGRRLGQDAS